MQRERDRWGMAGRRERGMNSARDGCFPMWGTKESYEVGIESEVECGGLGWEREGNGMYRLTSAEAEVKIF